jgi:SAM-dependent methyltransferase
MFEAEKTKGIREPDFIARFMSGTVLDIGCGHDLAVPHARPFDKRHGDANHIATYLPAESFDCVHSSHLLEHMHNPHQALTEWWSLIKPGGYMVIVVPEENLYEQGRWPSLFNFDHKWTFRIGGASSWSPVSLDVGELVEALPNCEVIEATLQDHGYDYSLRHDVRRISPVAHRLSYLRKWIMQKMLEIGVPGTLYLEHLFARIERRFGVPVDQTRLGAVAQIQVVLRKRQEGRPS